MQMQARLICSVRSWSFKLDDGHDHADRGQRIHDRQQRANRTQHQGEACTN